MSPYGGNSIKSLENFKAVCNAELQVKTNNLQQRYHDDKAALELQTERKIHELETMFVVVEANTAMVQGQVNSPAVIAVEKELAALTYTNLGASYSIRFWCTQFGEQKIMALLSDMLFYFLTQFTVKETLTGTQVMQLVARLISAQPELKIRELLFVLNRALNGGYGPTYSRIGIDTILGWLSQFYHDSAAHLEAERLNYKPESTRGTAPWQAVEKRLKDYETQQREKKRIAEKVWGIEKHRQQVKEYKEGLQP